MLAQITDALRRGDAAAALADARALAAAEPDNAAARHLLGVCLQRTGDLDGAREAFEQAIAAAPDHADYYFSLATLRLGQGDAPGAIRRLHEALQLDPNQLGAYVLLVHLAIGRGDVEEARRNLKLAQRVAEDHPQVKVAEGYVLQAQGDADGALRCFTAAATAAPDLAAAQLALGMAYLGRKVWPFAEQALANALALDPSRPPATLRALAEARRRQGKGAETLQVLGELLALEPDDLVARGLRAEILRETAPDAALADLDAILDRYPAHLPALAAAMPSLVDAGRGDDALRRVEAALALQPENDTLWRLRLDLSGRLGEDAKAMLDRWQEARPDSPDVLDLLAGYHDSRRETALAESYADRALALSPGLITSNLVKLADDLATDPERAVARTQRLLTGEQAATLGVSHRHTLHGWAGLAQDALGRHDEAAASWREMIRFIDSGRLPPPPPVPADAARSMPGTDAAAGGMLIVSPPGVRAEFLLRQIKPQLGPRLRMDRLQVPVSGDGFGSVRRPPGHPDAGTPTRWAETLRAVGLDPATTVDYFTFFDGYTLEAMRGARVIALLTDPRDALLNWMVHGSLQHFLFSDIVENSAGWLATVLEMLVDHHAAHPDMTHLLRLDVDPAAAAAELETLLGLAQPLPAVFGRGARFPTGHWRKYRTAFAKEFEMLAPVATRLGYVD